jgi:hypothetical protein
MASPYFPNDSDSPSSQAMTEEPFSLSAAEFHPSRQGSLKHGEPLLSVRGLCGAIPRQTSYQAQDYKSTADREGCRRGFATV